MDTLPEECVRPSFRVRRDPISALVARNGAHFVVHYGVRQTNSRVLPEHFLMQILYLVFKFLLGEGPGEGSLASRSFFSINCLSSKQVKKADNKTKK